MFPTLAIILLPISVFAMADVIVPNAKPVTADDIAIKDFDHATNEPGIMYQHMVANNYGTAPQESSDDDGPGFISINTGDAYDLDWQAARLDADPSTAQQPVVLPLLEDFPIEALEVKFRLLNQKF